MLEADREMPLRHLAGVARGQYEELAALTLVRADIADVGQCPLHQIEHVSAHARRNLDD
jgi:hypothetical protein